MSQIIDPTGFVADRFVDEIPVPLQDYAGGRALLVEAETNLSDLANIMEALDLIVIPFASNVDGRGFSLAGELRALGYRGHLRARGHVLVDQFRAALRCGYDDVEISAEQARRNPETQWHAVHRGAGYRSRVYA